MGASTRTRDVIICGTDFTKPAQRAADVAAALASTLERPLLLVHAAAPEGGARTSLAIKGSLKPRRADLGAEAARLAASGATVVHEVHIGHPDEVLAARARATEARLIVVASTGGRRGGRLGSVAERTAASASAPTLVVRDAAPFLAWLEGKRPLRLFVGFDFTASAEAAFALVRDLRRAGPCEVTVGQASGPDDLARVGYPDAGWSAPSASAAHGVLERSLRERARTLLDEEPAGVWVRPAAGHPDAALVEMAREAMADLIVTGTHQLQGLPRLMVASVSRGVLRDAAVSVATAPTAVARRRLPVVPAIRRVLVTTDFSPRGNRAVAHAFALTPSGGTVRLVHVVHPRDAGGGEYESALRPGARHDRYVQTCGRRLRALIPPEVGPLGIAVDAVVVERADPARGICEEAERFGADMIVMGSQGRTALGRVVLGSVAQAVMTASSRPVLVVRSPKG